MQDTIATDAVLIQLLETGDENAFQEIYKRYWYKLYTVARRKVEVQEDAEEIVQDIFVDLWERRIRLNINELDRYLFSAVKYKVLNYIKSRIVRQTYQRDTISLKVDADSNTEEALALQDLSQAITNGIENLPPKTQEIFRLNRLEGMSVREISDLLHIPERTVEYHITQSLRSMRVYLKDFVVLMLTLMFAQFH
ncbi:RNA polymerase sigma-70 factor [Dyadobacter diqingensis]|uniref:RNA polymerase sigma-70 factor n=1 Tax=Dyadobacter diqingensis TaxID=2938121 RepID=UPI0020C19D43|nr:RNA polymerase sigma-70 factor [Dyadobacter diqingensis]